MMMFIKENVNPKNKKTGDCVIRAIAKITNKSWEEVYRELVEQSIKLGYVFNDKRNYEKYLEKLGFEKMAQPRQYDGTKYLVSELDELVGSQCMGIISMANHLTCFYGWAIYDTWDCRRKTIGNYYIYRK